MTKPGYAQAGCRGRLIDSMVCAQRPELVLKRASCSPEEEGIRPSKSTLPSAFSLC
jgi:hypothetical protein